uniref:Macro domain-containing protein n=1 Tax=Araucaria cunninghamii TaxID=56994 RepID=A0A0D6R0D6_ARACU
MASKKHDSKEKGGKVAHHNRCLTRCFKKQVLVSWTVAFLAVCLYFGLNCMRKGEEVSAEENMTNPQVNSGEENSQSGVTTEENVTNPQGNSGKEVSQSRETPAPKRYRFKATEAFKLTESCLLYLHRGDITKWVVDRQSDAIVNAANERLLGGGGVDGAIHRAAGPGLLEACEEIPEVSPGVRCPLGTAKITRGFQLPVAHIIHTVGPIYYTEEDPESKLSGAYRSSLDLARENEVKYIAFPAISCGVYGYPYEEAAAVSLTTVRDFSQDLKEVHFVLFEAPACKAWFKKAMELFEPA